jgi:hypothetical protein
MELTMTAKLASPKTAVSTAWSAKTLIYLVLILVRMMKVFQVAFDAKLRKRKHAKTEIEGSSPGDDGREMQECLILQARWPPDERCECCIGYLLVNVYSRYVA